MKSTLTILLILALASSVSGQDAANKTPIPAEAAQAQATKLIKEVYGEEWNKAKTAAEKQALAKKLLGKANESKDDPASQFVLLRLARDIATQATDGQTAFQAIDAMAETFQVNSLEMKTAVLTKCAVFLRTPEQHNSASEEALKLVDQAVTQDKLTVANQLADLALAEARKAREKELITQAQSRITELAELAKSYEEVKTAKVTLEKTPDDPDANLIVGKYLCFVKGDWEKGVPMLALGKDEALKALAMQEIQRAVSSNEQAKLGDGWWSLAEKQKGTAKKQAQERAGYWYRKALPSLSGLMKDKVEKRVAAVEVVSAAGTPGKETSGKWLENLPRINVARDRVAGGWKVTKGKIITDGAGCSLIMLPVVIDGGYDLSLEFTRSRSKSGVLILLPIGDSQCDLVIGGWGGNVSGLEMLDGKFSNDNSTTKRSAPFVTGRNYALLAKVRVENETGSIEVLLDGRPFIQWTGQLSSLSPGNDWKLPQPKRPGLAAHEDPVFFQSVKLRAALGKVSFVTR